MDVWVRHVRMYVWGIVDMEVLFGMGFMAFWLTAFHGYGGLGFRV